MLGHSLPSRVQHCWTYGAVGTGRVSTAGGKHICSFISRKMVGDDGCLGYAPGTDMNMNSLFHSQVGGGRMPRCSARFRNVCGASAVFTAEMLIFPSAITYSPNWSSRTRGH